MLKKILTYDEILEKMKTEAICSWIGSVGLQNARVYRIGNDIYEQGISNEPEESADLFYYRTLEEARKNPYYQHLLEKLQ